jgi:hypothetical protein
MATALIIHAPEDALPARALAEKLRTAKLTVVLEKAAGDDVRDAVKGAQVTIALWSPRSIGNAAISEDVAFARGKSKLVHAQMQNAQTPQQFSADKSVNLTGWRGEDEFPPWRELAKLVTDRAGVAPLPPPTPRPPSGFFTPGRVDPSAVATADANLGKAQPASRGGAARQSPPKQTPPQRQAPPSQPRQTATQRSAAPANAPSYDAPKRGGGMGLIIGIVALVVIAGGAGAGYMWWQGQQASHASATALDQIDPNDPAALRAFVASHSGDAKTRAQTALNVLEERSYEAAKDADTVEALQAFLKDFPQSPQSQRALEVNGRIAELQANPPSTDTSTTTDTGGQPDNTQQAPSAAPTSTTTGPTQLTPPGEPSATQEPPSAPTTTTP